MSIKYYKDLIVWQKSIDLVTRIYEISRFLPKEEIYALTSQMHRAAISIPSNIAEGQQRNTTKDFLLFLYISKGSVAELTTQLIICQRLNYLDSSQISDSMELCEEVSRMLTSLINKLSTQLQS